MHLIIGFLIALGWGLYFGTDLGETTDRAELYSFFQEEEEHLVVDASVVREKLSRYGYVDVADGEYIIPKASEMPKGEWCSNFPETVVPAPEDWTCQDFSYGAAVKMSGYAFGVIWDDTVDGGHMQNVTLIDDDGVIRVAHYEPQTCQFKKLDNVGGVAIR